MLINNLVLNTTFIFLRLYTDVYKRQLPFLKEYGSKRITECKEKNLQIETGEKIINNLKRQQRRKWAKDKNSTDYPYNTDITVR